MLITTTTTRMAFTHLAHGVAPRWILAGGCARQRSLESPNPHVGAGTVELAAF